MVKNRDSEANRFGRKWLAFFSFFLLLFKVSNHVSTRVYPVFFYLIFEFVPIAKTIVIRGEISKSLCTFLVN